MALGGCSSSATTVVVSLDGAQSLQSLAITVELPSLSRTVQRTFGARTLPQTVIVELPDLAATVAVSVSAVAADGSALAASGAVQSVPHQRATLDLVLGTPGGDGPPGPDLGAGDLAGADLRGAPDLATPLDMSPVLGWHSLTPSGPGQRHSTKMVWDSLHNQVVLFGGDDAGGALPGTWLFDGTTWTNPTPAKSPGPRAGFAMTYDAERHVVVLFGGDTAGGAVNEVWEWDGTTWANPAPIGGTAPTAVVSTAIAFHAARHHTVLWSGWASSLNNNLNETWEWDGGTWVKQNPTLTPPGDNGHALAYDDARQVMVYVTGKAISGTTATTYEYDASGQWNKRMPAHAPTRRRTPGLVYDSGRGVILLFGGFDASRNDLADTWEWDGTDWTQRMISGPPVRRSFAIAYDSLHARTYVFGGASGHPGGGGNGPTTILSDTWGFY